MQARSANITRGLKQNCESRWYAVALLGRSVQQHQVPLSTIVTRPEARRAINGLSPVKAEVVKIIQDADDKFWPMLDQVLRIIQPFVDAIALCESRSVTLTVDEDVLKWVKIRAARTGVSDSAVIEKSLRRDLKLDLLDELWANATMSEAKAGSMMPSAFSPSSSTAMGC